MRIALFSSIRQVMKADKLCKKSNITVRVMPVPHIYSTECGMSLYYDDKDEEQLQALMLEAGITYESHPISNIVVPEKGAS